jgi:ribosomal protein S18 acetylase RimI-like enzyme
VISIRRAVPADAVAIGAVHVAAWRSAYPTILPDAYLARMSVTRQAIGYERSIRRGVSVHVAHNTQSGAQPGAEPGATRPRVVGFATAAPHAHALGDGEIETLYVLDDWRDQGIGRSLMSAVARDLAEAGCASAYCWVLRENPSRWFYRRVGGREVASASVRVAGLDIPQTAYAWNPIAQLFARADGGSGAGQA